jgi:hypothetical protein
MGSLQRKRSSCARLIRASRAHLYGGIPVEVLKDRANCDWESPTSLAISSRLMSLRYVLFEILHRSTQLPWGKSVSSLHLGVSASKQDSRQCCR